MWSLTCIPVNVYNTLYKFKPVFRCAQARHFWVFCWVLIAPILANGKGKLKERCQYLPPKLRYWTLMRMVRSGQWDDAVLVTQVSREEIMGQPWSLFRLKQRFQADLMREQVDRTEQT